MTKRATTTGRRIWDQLRTGVLLAVLALATVSFGECQMGPPTVCEQMGGYCAEMGEMCAMEHDEMTGMECSTLQLEYCCLPVERDEDDRPAPALGDEPELRER